MPNSNYNLEEQLREDRRIGNARRRKQRFHRMVPVLILLLLTAVGIYLLRPDEDTQETKPVTETVPPGSCVATLSFVGDISLDVAAMDSFRTENGYDFTNLFRKIVPRLAMADLTVGNLEGSVTGEISDHCYPPELLQALYNAGFDILQTANSYTIQNGITGLRSTKQAIQAAGMDALGTWISEDDRKENSVLIRDVNGIRIAFLSFTKGMNNLRLPVGAEFSVNLLYTDYDTNYSKIDNSAILNAVEEARMQNPDLIVAMLHWGSEFDRQVAESQEEIAELLFDNGVNLIIGSHSHYVGSIILKDKKGINYGKKLIAYSLGDFVSTADNSEARNGCILSVTVVKDRGNTTISNLSYIPTYSAAPSSELETKDYEVLDTLGAISFYKQGYYDRVSDTLYDQLLSAIEDLKEQTELPDNIEKK